MQIRYIENTQVEIQLKLLRSEKLKEKNLLNPGPKNNFSLKVVGFAVQVFEWKAPMAERKLFR